MGESLVRRLKPTPTRASNSRRHNIDVGMFGRKYTLNQRGTRRFANRWRPSASVSLRYQMASEHTTHPKGGSNVGVLQVKPEAKVLAPAHK
jgi:hypothetical protein